MLVCAGRRLTCSPPVCACLADCFAFVAVACTHLCVCGWVCGVCARVFWAGVRTEPRWWCGSRARLAGGLMDVDGGGMFGWSARVSALSLTHKHTRTHTGWLAPF